MPRDISLHKTSVRGYRPQNEDVERYNMNLSVDGYALVPEYAPVDFFVICDGHGGSQVAEFVAPVLENYFMDRNLVYPVSQGYLTKVYTVIQQELIGHPKRIARACGCTALVLVRYLDNFGKKNIQVINIGDCRAVLSRKGLPIPLCKDHKPFWSDEKTRIDQVNETCKIPRKIYREHPQDDWRVGDLSVSRSFGDLDNTPHVTHIPESFHYKLQSDDEFIVLGCDGLYDALQNHEVINFVRDHMNNNHINLYNIPHRYPNPNAEPFNKENIARKLADYAIARGSTDNVSIFIIFFKKSKD